MDSQRESVSKPTTSESTSICSEDKNQLMTDTGQEMDTAPVVENTEDNKQCIQDDDTVSGTSAISSGDATSEVKSESNEMSASAAGSPPQADAAAADSEAKDEVIKEMITFKVIYSKQKYDVTFSLDATVSSLKSHIETLTNVPSSMQKVMFKGKMKDDATLREQKVVKGSKIMVIGSTVNDVMSVSAPDANTMKEIEKQNTAAAKEPLCKQKPHKTILEKHGKPDDVMIGVKKHKEPLPPVPLSGMYNKSGGKVRLTFKLEQDQLWIGTKERTEKIPMASIKAVVSEPIEGHEEYHMMGIQLGPTEASRYWVYWVPAQYVDAIKDAVLGKWQTDLF
ncbi:hypothetical protein LSH36_97g05028 [Paralvinella palmiformis]|uniref:Ubiquitin-like domain-containing protein n=1 Tax=Paralvinella palmiformis TaxID=53620 RepID=A0AAD9K0H6_9ANNE|nr:hypothetical protein LSH36_97g05028 [Paralvinella palmiformis]